MESFQRMPTILVFHSLVVHVAVASQKSLHTMAFCNVWHNGNVFFINGKAASAKECEKRESCMSLSNFACLLPVLSFISVHENPITIDNLDQLLHVCSHLVFFSLAWKSFIPYPFCRNRQFNQSVSQSALVTPKTCMRTAHDLCMYAQH